ncbi:MAG: GNAT family N-acetyltransferase [Gaiellaceae bacterium MAG52_C11]|nr:GNAT family N-acetyltransferase [Candidatus Gaiellasilicea maunaloa]
MNVRRPDAGDLDAVLELMRAADIAVAGDSDWTASELVETWADLDLARDAWVLELDGRVVGYADFSTRGGRLNADGYVQPELRGRGIGSEIVRLTEERAKEEESNVPAGERVYLQNATLNQDELTVSFYRERGYEAVRGFRGMVIELEEAPVPAAVPGIEIRPYRHPDEARTYHAAHQESFAGHWEHRPTPWQEWEKKWFGRETFDPTLWWVAADGEEIAGLVFGEQRRDPDQGWVDVLGVRPAYRRRGIAEALLTTAFAEFFRRGERKVGLGVDAESPTGATRVYERAGMRTLWHAIVYEKELRAAREPTREDARELRT